MMRKICPALLLVLISILFCTSAAVADTIVLKSGKTIEGEIIEETDQLVAIVIDNKTAFYSKEEIQSINKVRLDVAKGRIIQATGTVEVLPKGETEWKPAPKGTSLNEGDSIRSGPDSKAVATFANQLLMAVEPQSEVALEKLQQSRKKGMDVKMNLNSGQLWNDVGKLKSKQAKFYIETPQAITGVRGTVFTVQVTPEAKTNVAVVRGTVDVRTRGMMMSPLLLRERTMTGVELNKAPSAPAAISSDFLAQWKTYERKFRLLRLGMLGANIGLSPMQTLAAAVAALIVLMVLVRLLFLRRRRSA